MRLSTTGPPCPCNSSTCSPVKECGATKRSAMPSSSTSPSPSRNRLNVAWRASGTRPRMAIASGSMSAPDTRTTPTPPRPGAVAIAAIRSGFAGGRFATTLDLLVDCPLLRNRQHVVGDPVQHQAGREKHEHDGKRHRHDHHDLGLHRIHRLRVQLDLQDRGHAHDHRQNEPRIRCGQIGNPAQPRRAAHFHCGQQHPVQRNEHRNLDQDRQTAAERIDFLGLVHLGHGLMQLGTVIAKGFLQLLQARRQLLHLGHRLVAGCR